MNHPQQMPKISQNCQQDQLMCLGITNGTSPMTKEYLDFVAKHGLDDLNNQKHEYINAIKSVCEKQGRPRIFEEIVVGAMKDEKKFLDAYGSWLLKNVKIPEDPK